MQREWLQAMKNNEEQLVEGWGQEVVVDKFVDFHTVWYTGKVILCLKNIITHANKFHNI